MSTETSFWHPYADMGSVRHSEHVMERAEDVWVWDTDGNRYLDATAGLWYANVGHGRPEIRAAVAAQMERLEACSAFFDLANPPALELAEALAERAPMPAKVFFGSGGSDGIDTAAKLARRYWWELGEPRPHGADQPHRRVSRHPRVRNRAWRHPQQPSGLRTAERDHSVCDTTRWRRWSRRSRGSAPSEWRRCSWNR